MKEVKSSTEREIEPKDQKGLHAKRWAFIRRTPSFMNWFESPGVFKIIRPYIKKGQVAADIGCGWGYYTFALATLVGNEGKVYSVELSEDCIQSIRKKAEKKGCRNIKAHSSTAADLNFIPDRSVDFVLANGLLCSMENDRALAVKEMKRILKPEGHIFISLGAAPPFGLVNKSEWKEILSGFKVEQGGAYKDLWALVSLQ